MTDGRQDVAGGGEFERIVLLAKIFDASAPDASSARGTENAEFEVGIGDDAAVLHLRSDTRLAWTVDAQVEDVHFRRSWLSWRDVGYRSFVAAASDISAMGASPWCALSALSLTPSITDGELGELAAGQKEAADTVGARILGGNLSSGVCVTVTTTLLGKGARILTRSGARVGDALWVAGSLGLAAAGLAALERGMRGDPVDRAVHAWRRPEPRVLDGLAMSLRANAAIDVSDGLAVDAGRVGEASGVSVVLDRSLLLARADDSLGRAAMAVGADLFDLILTGGEDYALVAASPVPIPGFSRVGEIRQGRGVIIRTERGEERPHEARGFDHFRGRSAASR